MMPWEKNIRKVVPYTPGEQPKCTKLIKLNTNENPYPPSPKVAEALKGLDMGSLRRYPDPAASVLVQELAGYYGVSERQVFVGVGSDDVLAMSFLAFFNSGKPILFPDITYSFYNVWAELFRIPYECPPLDGDFQICTEDYLKDCGGIVIPNPNAPTGVEKSLGELEEIIAGNPEVIVIIDEAYIDFGGESALSLLPKYENLLVVQTFSKSRSLAGMRIGYAIGNEKLIGYLNDVKYSFNSYTMDATALAAGVEAVRDDTYFKETLQKIINTRERTKKELRRLGFSFPDSKSNFIFATHSRCPAEKLFHALKQAGIYVRYFSKPRISDYLRISIGTNQEMDELIRFLEHYLGEGL
ncbi:MAG: histidinol-phosphate transaminase [Lachnospiraceae bacterium]|jgi:histidinol-phosphate aminotransferase|nr:histidinol-phosphate transaminase [Lachnospiraceae bacterium]